MQNIFSPDHSDKSFQTAYKDDVMNYRYSRDGYGNGKTDDRSFVLTLGKITIQGMFDGHSGSKCVDYIYEHFPGILTNTIMPILRSEMSEDEMHKSLRPAITQAFIDFNIRIHTNKISGGSTATIIIITKSLGTVCFIGDSPYLIMTENKQILTQMTTDHSPDNPSEVERVTKSGGRIGATFNGPDTLGVFHGPFIQGLAMTRGFGHLLHSGEKSSVIADPDFNTFEIPEGQRIIVCSCTDFVTEKIVNLLDLYGRPVKKIRNQRNFVDEVCQELLTLNLDTVETTGLFIRSFVDNIVESFCFNGRYSGDNACITITIIPAREMTIKTFVKDLIIDKSSEDTSELLQLVTEPLVKKNKI